MPKKLPWIFGGVVAVTGIIENQSGAEILGDHASFGSLFSMTTASPETILFPALVFIFLFGVGILGKSNLIASLAFVAGKTGLSNHPDNARAVGKNFFRALLLEGIALLALLAVIGILAIPLLIASSRNLEAQGLIAILSILTFIPVAIIIFLIKQLSLFYLLLSPVRTRGAIEVGSALFYRHIVPSLLFGLFALTLAVLFTFLTNLIILIVVLLFGKLSIPLPEIYASLAIGAAAFTWFAVFQQALWLVFFKSIAGPRVTETAATEKAEALISGNLPETPPA